MFPPRSQLIRNRSLLDRTVLAMINQYQRISAFHLPRLVVAHHLPASRLRLQGASDRGVICQRTDACAQPHPRQIRLGVGIPSPSAHHIRVRESLAGMVALPRLPRSRWHPPPRQWTSLPARASGSFRVLLHTRSRRYAIRQTPSRSRAYRLRRCRYMRCSDCCCYCRMSMNEGRWRRCGSSRCRCGICLFNDTNFENSMST